MASTLIAPSRSPMWHPAPGTEICPLSALDEKPARSFVLRAADNQDNQDNQLDIIVWRHDGEIRAYVNQCPHLKVPLETFPDRFLTRNGKALICSAHGAQFAPSGRCFIGPCEGDALTTIAIDLIETAAGKVIVFMDLLAHS